MMYYVLRKAYYCLNDTISHWTYAKDFYNFVKHGKENFRCNWSFNLFSLWKMIKFYVNQFRKWKPNYLFKQLILSVLPEFFFRISGIWPLSFWNFCNFRAKFRAFSGVFGPKFQNFCPTLSFSLHFHVTIFQKSVKSLECFWIFFENFFKSCLHANNHKLEWETVHDTLQFLNPEKRMKIWKSSIRIKSKLARF